MKVQFSLSGSLASAALVLGLAVPTTAAAEAAAPTLTTVGQQDRHATATFSMPGADDATIYFATKPDRASDGRFLDENIEHLDFFTDNEIQAGRWLDEAQLDPGQYHVMLNADDSDCFGDPNCLAGFSNVLTFSIPKPAPRYRGKVRVYGYLSTVQLTFRVAPLGERRPYRVCWRLVAGRRKCVRSAVSGYSWNSPAEDQIDVRKRGMPRVVTFAWYVDGRKVASKRARIRRRPS
jgi:hypothetical protein